MAQTIVVVEDNLERQQLFHRALDEAGYAVLLRTNLRQAAQAVRTVPLDALILSLMFHNLSVGWELIQRLRQSAATAHVPVIIANADNFVRTVLPEKLVDPATAAGASGVWLLAPPVTGEAVVAVVAQALAHPAAAPPPPPAAPL